MSRTLRRSFRSNEKGPEGRVSSIKRFYGCRCSYCMMDDKRKLQDKIAKREMLNDLQQEINPSIRLDFVEDSCACFYCTEVSNEEINKYIINSNVN